MSTWNPILDYLIEVITLKNVIIFAVLYFFVIWISILIWVIKDITNRTDKLYLHILSILSIVIFTPFGIILYLIIRPNKTLFEQYKLEIESNLEFLSEEISEKIKVLEKEKWKNKKKKKSKTKK